jgi:hypothetical protein
VVQMQAAVCKPGTLGGQCRLELKYSTAFYSPLPQPPTTRRALLVEPQRPRVVERAGVQRLAEYRAAPIRGISLAGRPVEKTREFGLARISVAKGKTRWPPMFTSKTPRPGALTATRRSLSRSWPR